MNVNTLKDKDIAWADIVFLSAMTVQRKSVNEVIARVKAMGKPIVAGGPLFTMEKESFPEVDHLILNEGEITFPMFLQDLALGKPRRVYETSEFADIRVTPEMQPGYIATLKTDGVNEALAREAFALAAAKLPIATTFVTRHLG